MKSRFSLLSLVLLLSTSGCDIGGGNSSGETGDYNRDGDDTDGNHDTGLQGGTPEAPLFSVASGDIEALTEVLIDCPTSEATARFTTDGSTPDAASQSVSGGVVVVYEDMELAAVCVLEGITSSVTRAEYTARPLYPDFEISLDSGHRWDYTYTWDHWVGYSSSGDTSFDTTKDFSIILGKSEEMGDLTAYEVIVVGNYNIDWKYLATDGYRLLGSEDGENFKILFDAMLGYWAGESFFLDFNGSDDEENLLSASFTGDTATISDGWYFSDDDSAYYPGLGTIHDPDAWSSHSSKTETYKAGTGPTGYTYSSGTSTSWESTSDTYTVELNSFTTGVDYSSFSPDLTLAPSEMERVQMDGPSLQVHVDSSRAFTRYVVFAHFSDNGYNPSITVMDENFETIISGWDESDTNVEIYKTEALDGSVHIKIKEASGQEDGEVRVTALPIYNPDDDTTLEAYIPETEATTTLGSWEIESLDVETYAYLTPPRTVNTYTNYYFFAIPLSDSFDTAIGLVDGPASSTSYWYRKINQNGEGEGEAFHDLLPVENCSFDVFDADYDTPGDVVFGMGEY